MKDAQASEDVPLSEKELEEELLLLELVSANDIVDELYRVGFEDELTTNNELHSMILAKLFQVPETLLWSKIHTLLPNKPSMTSIEFTVVRFMVDTCMRHHAASGNSPMVEIWDEHRASLYSSLELIQLGLYAFLGMKLLSNHNHHYLLDHEPIDDGLELSIAKIYTFSMSLYNYLLKAVSQWMGRVLANTCTQMEALILDTSLGLLMLILGSLPPGTCPLIDFTQSGNDFIAYTRGYLRTYAAIFHHLRDLPFEWLCPPINCPTLPFFIHILEFIDTHTSELGTADEAHMIKDAFGLLARNVYAASVSSNPDGYYHIFNWMNDGSWDLVYAQQPLALSWLNVLAAYAQLFKLYYIRDQNIWVDYMDWYRAWHGHSFAWDEPLYQVVVEQGFVVDDYALLHSFNPLGSSTIPQISQS